VPTRVLLLLTLAAFCSAQPAKNPFAKDAQAAETGRAMFRIYCAPCHGIQARGGRGPDLTRGTYFAGESDSDLYRIIANGVPGTEMPSFSDQMDEETIWRLVTYIRSSTRHDAAVVTGNAAAGEKLFWGKGGCGQCHRVGTKGGRLGPDLTREGRQRTLEYLRESVVSPNEDLTPGYATVKVVTRDGKTITGVQKGFDNFSAQLMDANEKFYSFEKDNVASIQREFRSLMPDTYGKLFTPAELNDLLAYLITLRGKP
jgi:cytochrome c oxidase cbb3-type subunit III